MVPDIRQAQRPRVPDQLAEHSVTAWQCSDRGSLLRIDPNRDEALELPALVVQDAQAAYRAPVTSRAMSTSSLSTASSSRLETRPRPTSIRRLSLPASNAFPVTVSVDTTVSHAVTEPDDPSLPEGLSSY